MYTSYFWDSENLGTDILRRVEELDKSDKLYIFYSSNSSKASFNLVNKIRNAKCYIEFIECETGTPNAMDFKIVSFIGLKIGGYKHKKNKHRYIILSKDTGYDTTIRFLQEKNININRWIDLIEEDDFKQKQDILNAQKEEEQVRLNKKMYDTIIRDCIIQSKDLSNFHGLLQKNPNEYIKKHYSVIYRQYKQHYKEIKYSS